MGRNAIETVLGALVLLVAALFLSFAYKSADLQKVQGYTVSAYFPMVDGLKEGIDVKVNGVKVGSISGLKLITEPGPNQYKVDVKMTILPNVLLPTDTIAMVASESLLGGKYMSLEIGVDEDMIKTDGSGRITHTQAPMRLDDLIGQLIYNSKKSDASSGNAPPPPPTSQAAPTPSPAPAVQKASPAPAKPAASKPAPNKEAPAASNAATPPAQVLVPPVSAPPAEPKAANPEPAASAVMPPASEPAADPAPALAPEPAHP